MIDPWAINACAWFVALVAFGLFLWWVLNLRSKIQHYLAPIDKAAAEMSKYNTAEEPEAMVARWKLMSNDELVREIRTMRKFQLWGSEINRCLEGLKASVPFLGCCRR